MVAQIDKRVDNILQANSMTDEEMNEYVLDMFKMVWRDSQMQNDKDSVCNSAANMVMNRVKSKVNQVIMKYDLDKSIKEERDRYE